MKTLCFVLCLGAVTCLGLIQSQGSEPLRLLKTIPIPYDSENRRVYASCGEGFISVLEHRDLDHYQVIARIPTATKARTSLLVPALKRFYLAVPKQGGHDAELRVYEVRGMQS